MSKLNRLRDLAGIETVEESARGDLMVDKILQMAEASAYDEGAERGNVTSDDVFAAAQKILLDIEQGIVDRLKGEMQ